MGHPLTPHTECHSRTPSKVSWIVSGLLDSSHPKDFPSGGGSDLILRVGRVPTAKEYLLFPALVSIYKWLSFVPKSHGKCVQVKESGNHSNLGSGGQQGNRLQKQGDYASQQVDLP
jgi:hypothetical protein